MIIETIGLGMLMSLLLTEVVGMAAGGIVVPGYIALSLHRPLELAITILVSFVTLLVIKILSRIVILYGRRMLVVSILFGYFFVFLAKQIPGWLGFPAQLAIFPIGFVIPGLIAYWMERQGVIETICAMFIAATATRFIIIIISQGMVFK
jgi:poly-gamma-glutamate biosynthesis protein PgsC/CapC